jgi:uncharacterized protein YidB (DUF937 family)
VIDILRSFVGGALQGTVAKAAAQVLGKTDLGSVDGLLQRLELAGLGPQVASWLGNGEKLPISGDQLRKALGERTLDQLAGHLGLDPNDLLRHMAKHLPGAIDLLNRKPGAEFPARATGRGS